MRRLNWKKTAVATALLLAGAAPATAADQALAGKEAMPGRVVLDFNGPGLVTSSGVALYVFAAENTKSDRFRWQCTNAPGVADQTAPPRGVQHVLAVEKMQACTTKYKPYVADANARPVGDFTIVQRPDGGPAGLKQWAYKGFPLYTNIKDRRPGDRNATNGGGPPPGPGGRAGPAIGPNLGIQANLVTGVRLARVENGMVLNIAANNRPLYTPAARQHPVENDEFQPFFAPAIATVSGDWSMVDAGAGQKQYAFRGKPLYLAPPSMSDYEISQSGKWETVAYQKIAPPPAQIGKQMTLLGEVYTTGAGRTLYRYSCSAGPASCEDAGDPAVYMVALCGDSKECARRWHPFAAPANARPQGEWSIIDVTYPMFLGNGDGGLFPAGAPKVKAWAYRGSPVYTYYEDTQPGDIWGNKTTILFLGSAFNALLVPGRAAD